MIMDNEKGLPKRKSTRRKNFDYSSAGAYFVTICVRDRMQILSEIVRTDLPATYKTIETAVGEGLAPPVYKQTGLFAHAVAVVTSEHSSPLRCGQGLFAQTRPWHL